MSLTFRIFSRGEILEDRYKIEKELSRGGMSIVYLAIDLETGNEVVLKQPKPDVETKQNVYCDTIRHEANILSRIDHPNIVKYSNYLHTDNILVEEYIEGKSISEIYCAESAEDKDTLNISIKLCEVLIYLHRNGVVHRDICPKNILLDHKGMPHVIDFGTAHDMKQDDCIVSNVQHGPYSCPEPVEELNNRVKLQAMDTFSFGATLYTLLSTSSPPILSDGMTDINLRGNSLFKNIITRTTNIDPYLRDKLDNVLALLKELESVIKFKPIIKITKSNDPKIKVGTLFFLDKANTKIGRDSHCDIDLPVRFVTPVHARIHNKGTEWTISDSNSSNGTFLNGEKVMPGERLSLHHGDRIWLVYNPDKSKDPYIQMEFLSDRKAVEAYYNEVNNLEIKTSWEWDGPALSMTVTVKNNSKQPWNNICVDFSSLRSFFRTEDDLNISFELEPGKERYYRRDMALTDSSIGGDFSFPMLVYVGTRLIRDETIHMRYGESFRPSTGLEVSMDKRMEKENMAIHVKMRNVSPYTYTRINLGVGVPDGLELVEPDSPLTTIPMLASNEEYLIAFKLKPRRKLKTTIHFDMSYLDHLGKKKQADIPGVPTGEIFPFIEPHEVAEADFLKAMDHLSAASLKTMYKDITLSKAKKRVCDVCNNFFRVGEQKEKSAVRIFFSGRTRVHVQILFVCSILEGEDNIMELRFDAFNERQDLAEEFLNEQVGSIDRALRLDKALHVTKYTKITDSVLYKSKLSGDVSLKDSVAYKSGQ